VVLFGYYDNTQYHIRTDATSSEKPVPYK